MNNKLGSTRGHQMAHSINQVAPKSFKLHKRAVSTASNRSLASGDTSNVLFEGGKSQSSKRGAGQTAHVQSQSQSGAEPQQNTASHSSAIVMAQGVGSGSAAAQYIAAELVAANNTLSKGVSGARNANMANQHRNSKNRKLYTSIGAYNNRAEDQYVGMSGSKQGFMATAGPTGGIPGNLAGGFSVGGQSGVIPQGQQNVAQGSLHAALARKMQHAQVHQQRNIVLSQQQSLVNKMALLPESEEDLRRLQVQHLLSHQGSVNQSNQSQMQQNTGMAINSEARGTKASRDRVGQKKSANSSVLVVPSRDLQTDIAKNLRKQVEPNTALMNHSAATQIDSSQISMISRIGHEGMAKESLGAAQLAAYNSTQINAEGSLPQTSFNDTSVLSGPAESNNGNMGYNTALIVKQRGLNNMSQIVATSNQLSSAQTQAISKYKNINALQGFNSQQPNLKDRSTYHGQAAHNSVIIEKNSSSDKGVKQVKRNTLVKITNSGMKPNNFTQVGNYVDSQSKEYLENSFHEIKGLQRAHANQSEIQRTQPGHLGHGKNTKSKLQTIGSSNKVNKHATVGASDSLVAQQLSQNQVNFISNFHIEDQELQNEQKKQQAAPNQQSTSKSGNLAKNQQNYILLQTQHNTSLTQKQRPHSSFKAQTQKPINSFKQHLVNLNGVQTQQPSAVTAHQQTEVLSGKALIQNVVTAQAHTSGRKATNHSQQQQILIGADGVVGIGGIGSAGSLTQTKGVASRKSKHLAQPINKGVGGKNLLIGKTQKLNQMSVYQNQIVGEMNHREPRRIGRGGSGIDSSGLGVRNELSNITKDHREMRTSSAAAGNTNNEFKLLNLTGTVTQGHSGNALNNGAAGIFNLNNHNQNYQIGGPGPADASASHVLSGISAISGHSGGGVSNNAAILTVPQNKNGPQGAHAILNATSSSQKATASTKAPNGKNKSSKRNIAAAGAGSNQGVPNFPIENLLSSTNKSLINASNTEQMALIQNIDSIRSGDGGLATRGSVLGGGGVNGLMSTGSKNPAGLGINMHPAKLYEQDSRQNANKSTNGGGVRASSKASKGSVRQSILSGNGAPAKQTDNTNISGQANRAHQQSMQKFLQQQMTMYNIQQNPSRGATFNNQAPKNAKRAQGLGGINSNAGSKQAATKQRDGQIMNYYNTNIQNLQYASTQSQMQAQGHQGQCLSQGQAQPQGQGSGGGKGLKSSAQKLTKKQIHQQNQLASDRLRGSQQHRENKDVFRKGGTQTAIGTGFSQTKNCILNSNPLQVQRQSSQKQSHSLSRSRVTSQNHRQQQVISHNIQQPGSGGSSAQGNKKGIKALSSVPGQTPTIGGLGSLSATPGIHLSHLMRQMNADGSNSAAMAAHQRTNFSHMNQSNISANPRLDMYRAVPNDPINRAQTVSGVPSDGFMLPESALVAAHHLATSLSSGAAANKNPDSNRQFPQHAAVSEFDILELTHQQLRQIQTAESAVNEMRIALNQHKASDVVMITAGETSGKGDKALGQQSQQRPRSQNDMHSNYVPIDGVDSDGLAEMMALVPSREVDMQAELPLDAMSYQSKHKDGNNVAFRPVENNQSRLWSQERLQNSREEEVTTGFAGSLEFINHGLSDTQGINSTFIERNETKQAGQADDEIDKEQFLIIVSNAFEKIMKSMHPVLGNNLKHIKNMYTHFIEQVEQNHHHQLQENSNRIQSLEQLVAELQSQNQSLSLQVTQKASLHDEKNIQLTALAAKNKELQKQNQKTIEENRLLKANYSKLKESFEKQKQQIDFFKGSGKEEIVIQQEQNDRAGRDLVSRAVIQEMKQNFAGNANQREAFKETEIEKLKRMELNVRTKEVHDSNIVFQDEAESIVGGIPEFTAADLENDPLDLDGDIGKIGKLNFASNHVRITQGDIIEGNQRVNTDIDGIERDQDTGRIADRYARDRNASRLGHRGKMSRRGLNDDLTEDEVADVELSSIPSYDMSKMHTEQPRVQDVMMNELEFDQGIDLINENSINREDGQSYFSSRIHSSSETFRSEIMMAYQQAIRMNQVGPSLPEDGSSSRKVIETDQKARKDRQNQSNGQKDDASGTFKSKIKVPALNFNILHSQQEREINQEELPLDESQQDLQDLVNATDECLAGLDQDQKELDQMAPPQPQQTKGFTKHKLPIMNISMLDNKMPVPSQAFEASEPHNNTKNGISQPKKISDPAGPPRPTHGLSLGFSIDLTKLKAKSGGGAQDDANGNDYQLEGVPNGKPQDFQDEFMAKYDEFSESWRRMIERQKRF